VMMLSAIQKEAVEERCYGMGAQAFVRKPFDPDMLLGTLEEMLDAPPALTSDRIAREPRDMPLSVILAWRGGG
jgi:DNA-binding response OmpR family regulator